MSSRATENSFASWIDGLPATRTAVLGDLILDRYTWGDVDRISPEAPIPVLDCRRDETRLGGAANVALNVSAMGGTVHMFSAVGADEPGRRLKKELAEENIRTDGLLHADDRQTPVKTRMIARGQQVLRMDQEDTHRISPREQDRLIAALENVIDRVQVLLVCDYRKGVLTPELLETVFRLCKKQDVPAIVDPKGQDYSRYHGAHAITPNRTETERATGIEISADEDYRRAADTLIDQLGVERVVITRGPEGMSLFRPDGTSEYVPAETIEVYDVTGAGDTVVAALGVALGAGTSDRNMIRLANLAGARAVETLGNAVIPRSELIEFQAGGGSDRSEKIVERETLLPLLERKREGDRTVVFTNGCFDLLHEGHLKTLEFAADQGSFLVVGLNSDASVRSIKGEGRPVRDERERARLLAALEVVDFVVVFDEDTPASLIREIVPDVLVKGEDYREKEVVGREVVESAGGRVAYAPLLDGVSTTELIRRIREGGAS